MSDRAFKVKYRYYNKGGLCEHEAYEDIYANSFEEAFHKLISKCTLLYSSWTILKIEEIEEA